MQIDDLIDWALIEETIVQHYSPASDVTGRPAYPGLFLYKMLLVGIWHGGLSSGEVVKNKPLTQRQRQRNRLITKARYVVERTFDSQVRWFG